MFETGVTIGDELLQQVLSRSSDAQMKSIVATIQTEQNRIIRNDRSRMLIVQGAAGSGKTSAALQRVAYLLYKYRDSLQANQMVLFSPNPMFNSYVSTVLPELGEENMEQTTFQQYLEHRLSGEYLLEDPFTQIEYLLSSMDEPGYNARVSGIRYKSSVDYLKAIGTYRNMLEQRGMLFKPLTFRGREIVSAARMQERFYAIDPTIRLTNRIVLLSEWLREELIAYERAEQQEAWVEEELELLDKEDYMRAYKQLKRMQKGIKVTFDDFENEKLLLSRMVVYEHLKPLRKAIKQLRFVDMDALYKQIFMDEQLLRNLTGEAKFQHDWTEICQQTITRMTNGELAYEDATPYLYLHDLILGFQANTGVRHVIIDEAQDYSQFQLEFLKRLFPRCRMTALGDLNQAIYAHASVLREFEPIMELYGAEQTEIIRLTRSYRSTFEIVDFTSGMVKGGEEIVPFNRNGEKPIVKVVAFQSELFDRVVSDIDVLLEEGFKSIAIICKTASEAQEVFNGLQERLALNLITKQTSEFAKGILVIPAYLAKGVEFDAVLIHNASLYSREQERKLFYTACTRAMHLLTIYSLGEQSSFITALQPDTYLCESTRVPS